MSTNYEQAKSILDGLITRELYKDVQLKKASALATLALVDEMRAGRKPELNEVYLVQQYNPETGEEMHVDEVHRNRAQAYAARDQLNEQAHAAGAPLRYIVNVKMLL